MPNIEHVNTIVNGAFFEYTFAVNVNKWIYGEEAAKLGRMHDTKTGKSDIIGLMLSSSGYSAKQYSPYRTPSQFAQMIQRSGRGLSGIASFLVTPGHADTDFCIELGKLNDSNLDMLTMEENFGTIFRTKSIGVRFYEPIDFNTITRTDDTIVELQNMFETVHGYAVTYPSRPITHEKKCMELRDKVQAHSGVTLGYINWRTFHDTRDNFALIAYSKIDDAVKIHAFKKFTQSQLVNVVKFISVGHLGMPYLRKCVSILPQEIIDNIPSE